MVFNELILKCSSQLKRAINAITYDLALLCVLLDAGTRSAGAVGGGSGQCQGDIDSCTNRRVVEWKFSELDKDKDMELKRKELKTLRYLVNKLVEPYACALSFLDYCDWDSNKKIGLPEWSKCLRVVHITANGNNSE